MLATPHHIDQPYFHSAHRSELLWLWHCCRHFAVAVNVVVDVVLVGVVNVAAVVVVFDVAVVLLLL